MSSKNVFTVCDSRISIFTEGWPRVGFTSYRDDYYAELTSVTWHRQNGYLRNSKLGYLHRYIASKWYGIDLLEEITSAGWVVDHLNNDGFDCTISNLAFLHSDENKAKGFTVDKKRHELRERLALNFFRDFSTGMYQMTLFFNEEAYFQDPVTEQNVPVVGVRLLYDCDYRLVINDAREILLGYELQRKVRLTGLHCIDIELCKPNLVYLGPEERDSVFVERGGKIIMILSDRAKVFQLPPKADWLPK